jgi:hypothetical protein
MSLEDELRAAAKAGNLNYFTIIPIHKTGEFKAQYGQSRVCANHSAVDKDPVKAALAAFADSRKRGPRAAAKLPKANPTDKDVFDDTEFG